jgi:hypothetical protein
MNTNHELTKSLNYIATLECSNGNAEVGNMWLEHKICTSKTTIEEIMSWKEEKIGCHGRLIIAKAT